MATQTIIIECNRREAVKDLEQSEADNDILLYDINAVNKDTLSNSSWKNHLDHGISIEIGDRIKVESASLNARSASDSVMEFVGDTGYTYPGLGTKIDDRRAGMTFAYYINNRYQFNFNLPKSTHAVIYDMYMNNYGQPRLYAEGLTAGTVPDNFYAFVNCYPYQATEGFEHNSGTPKTFTQIHANLYPSFTKGATGFNGPTPERLYIGQEVFTGPTYISGSNLIDIWQYYNSEARFEIPLGFSTPATVASVLTDQLHQMSGTASSWTTLNVPPVYYELNGGSFSSYPLGGISDTTMRTFPTAPGQLLYNHVNSSPGNANYFPAIFEGETGTRGDDYEEASGNANFWSYMMCGNPDQYICMSRFIKTLQTKPGIGSEFSGDPTATQSILTLYTGEIFQTSNDYINFQYSVGEWGNHPYIITSALPSVNHSTSYTNNGGTQTTNANTAVLNMTINNIIPTNIVFNATTLALLEECYSDYSEIQYSTPQISRANQNFLTSNVVPWVLGRLDDEASYPGVNKYLSNIVIKHEKDTAGIYPPGVVGTGAGNSYDLFDHRDPTDSVASVTCASIYGFDNTDGSRYAMDCAKFLPPGFTALNAQKNTLPGNNGGLYPNNANAEWQTNRPDGNYEILQDQYEMVKLKFSNLGIGIVPIYIKSGGWINLQNIAFVGVILAENINPTTKIIPKPYYAEFFSPGSTPSITQNKLAKIITTQKVQAPYRQADPGGGFNDYVSPEAYVPFVMAGASDVLVNFDPGFSRFTLSNLHTSVRSGNGPYQNSDIPPNEGALDEVLTINESEAYICQYDVVNNYGICYNDVKAVSTGTNPIISAQSGVSLLALKGIFSEGKSLSASGSFLISEDNILLYKNTLFDKMGFDYEQMFPLFGSVQNEFNRGNHNLLLGYNVDALQKTNQMVKPFTTNAYVSSAIMISLCKNTNGPLATPNNPCADLGAPIPQNQAEVNATSDLLIASNQPVKLSYPQLTIYSDIVRNSRYYGSISGKQLLQAVAFITRNYSESDYFFGFATSWDYVADMNYILTDINVSVNLPNGSPAPLDPNSSIIFSITKPKYLPLPPPIEMKSKHEDKQEE